MDKLALFRAREQMGFAVSDLMMDQIMEFEERLYSINETRNLTRIKRQDFIRFHLLDSLLLSEFIPIGARVLDIGTGAGFPAWPLACLRADLSITAMDSTSKMIDFLRGSPLPNLSIIEGRAEDLVREKPSLRESFDFVTGRAVAPLSIQLELSSPYCKVGGLVVPMRTPNDELGLNKLTGLGLHYRISEIRSLPLLDLETNESRNEAISRVFPHYDKVTKCDKRFPRKWAEMKQNQLI